MGLYAGAGGRRMRQRRLFRSDHLGTLQDQDIAALSALGIGRVLDLRGVTERSTAVCALPGVQVHSLAIEPTIVQVLSELAAAGHTITADDVVAHMQDTYRGFVRQNTHRFAELFGHLLEADAPVVFHCTAGKDRTGFAAALIQRALGVSQEDVLHDYLLTNERLKPPAAARHGLAPEVARVLWRVQPEFLQASFDALEQAYGGLQGYLREGLQLRAPELERLHALYLEP
ncbi:MAG: tyrosine-protein phosphatase, partial [Comamonadaceae bacterium]